MGQGRVGMGMLAVVVALVMAPAAHAAAREAGSVLPPGQSGFVSPTGILDGTGSPHLKDQLGLFLGFDFKPAGFGQPGSEERPRPGVRIVRDSYGVPAITGDSAGDLWWGAGYAVAQDRLFQLEAFRRATSGRLAELLGRSVLEDDIVARRDYYTEGELAEQFARLPQDMQARYEAYRQGVNAWIAETRADPGKLPGEFIATGVLPDDWGVLELVRIGVFLARTVPSGDGEELRNVRALRALGSDWFDRLLPLRVPGQVPTIPRAEGRFPSNPGRTRAQEERAFEKSAALARSLPLPGEGGAAPASASADTAPAGIGRTGGSNMWAIRGRDGTATLFNGPQLGFSIPELFIELELHGPGLDVRGATAPGAPVIATGHNGHVAWGVTSGLTDEDDLYVEDLVGEEAYRFRGEARQMDCRNETFTYRPPPSELLGLIGGSVPDLSAGTHTERICRTVHGPVQARGDGVAYARRYAVWGREAETLEGLAAVNEARSIEDVDRAMDLVSWNENLMAADDRGNIGYWHPGLLPMRPRNWDERLPVPGTGGAEWRGFIPPGERPQAINPEQGYLVQWNNVPSVGWTTGDGVALERVTGRYHRTGLLRRVVKAAHAEGGGYAATARVDRVVGATAQNRPLASAPLKAARRGSQGAARTVLDTILAWDGDYATTDDAGTVHAGVATFDAFKQAAIGIALEGVDREDAELLEGGRSSSHEYDVTLLEAFALRTLDAAGYRRAAEAALPLLEQRFGSSDPASWREPRRMYEPGSQGAASLDPFPFFDRGTFQHVVELGP
ncbi:MAG: penicillin acylase family protein [Thermoleophilaceae bacterium]